MSEGWGICQKHGSWELSGHDCPGCEIADLRAEVERLNVLQSAAVERERDEALAQVAWLLNQIEMECHGTHPGLTTHTGRLCRAIRENPGVLPTKTRALLDRLQRAEAVVEALKETLWFMETTDYGVECTIGKQHNIYQEGKEALAAWEEEECPSCGETMDGVCHGKSPCNVVPT